jgi:hypothetical protein
MEANSTISAWPIVIGGLVVIGVTSYYVYHYMQKRKIDKSSNYKDITNNISSEFTLIVKCFSGNMNALRNISINADLSLAKITFDNIQKTVEVKGTEKIKKWYYVFGKDRNSWDEVLYKNKAKEVMKILIECGVHIQEEKDFVWENDFSKRYNKLSQIQSGQECKIVAPYWIYNGEIFEKGLVTVK